MRSRIDRNGGVNGAWCRGERHRLTDWLRVPASVVWLPLSSADLAEWCVHPFIPLRPRRTIQGPLQFSIPNRRHDEGRGRPFVYHAARLGAPFPRDSIAAPPFNAGIKVSLPIFRLFTATAATIAHVRLCWQCVGQAIALRTEGGGREKRSMDVDWWFLLFSPPSVGGRELFRWIRWLKLASLIFFSLSLSRYRYYIVGYRYIRISWDFYGLRFFFIRLINLLNLDAYGNKLFILFFWEIEGYKDAIFGRVNE